MIFIDSLPLLCRINTSQWVVAAWVAES